MTSALVRFTTGPDVIAHAERAAAMIKQLRAIAAGAATMFASAKPDLTPVSTFAGIGDELNGVVKDQHDWYSLYVTGPSKALRDALEALAAALRVQAGRPATAEKLAALLAEQAAVCEQHVVNLDRSAAAYDIAAGHAAASAMPEWLATHLPGEQPLEAFLVLHRMGPDRAKHQFASYLERARSERTGAKVAVDRMTADIEGRLAKSRLLAPYTRDVEGLIAGNLTVLGDEAFIAAYVGNFLTVNAKVIAQYRTSARVLPVSEVDNVEGFHHAGKVVIRPETDLSGGIHEALHALSHRLTGSAWNARFGMPLEEAACEYVTRLVAKEQQITVTGDGYHNNVALLEKIISTAGLTPAHILAGYLGGDVEPVAKAIVTVSGEKGLQILTSSQERMCYQTYYAWVDQYDETQRCTIF